MRLTADSSHNLQRLRKALPVMQAERDALPPTSVFRPSAMWTDIDRAFNFIFDLSDDNLRDIRLHTGPLLSYVGTPKTRPVEWRRSTT